MAILSTAPASASPLADTLSRLRAALRGYPTEFKWLGGIVAAFLLAFFMPVGAARFDNAILEGLALLNWYAREHVVLCLVPAFFIAGAIAVFISQDAVIKYLGPAAHKAAAYGVASVSGSILAVCSCTVLPLFGGIYRRGAVAGHRVSLFRPGHQRAGHRADRQDSRDRAGRRAGGRRGELLAGDRPARALDLPPRGAGAGGHAKRFRARRRSRPTVGRNGNLFRADGRRAGVRQLGAGPRRGQRGVARVVRLEMAADHIGRHRPGRVAGLALALLLAGPALSLPNMLVIRGILGAQKTVVYCSLVVVTATLTGWVFGTLYP